MGLGGITGQTNQVCSCDYAQFPSFASALLATLFFLIPFSFLLPSSSPLTLTHLPSLSSALFPSSVKGRLPPVQGCLGLVRQCALNWVSVPPALQRRGQGMGNQMPCFGSFLREKSGVATPTFVELRQLDSLYQSAAWNWEWTTGLQVSMNQVPSQDLRRHSCVQLLKRERKEVAQKQAPSLKLSELRLWQVGGYDPTLRISTLDFGS